jgi:hypothetical protein
VPSLVGGQKVSRHSNVRSTVKAFRFALPVVAISPLNLQPLSDFNVFVLSFGCINQPSIIFEFES